MSTPTQEIQDLHDRLVRARRDRGYTKVALDDLTALRKFWPNVYETSDEFPEAPWQLVRERQDYIHSADFPWGRILERHFIGEYQFIEFIPKQSSNQSDEDYAAAGGKNQRYFSALINGRSIGRSYKSLDEALIGVVSYKFDGPNTRADRYFLRAIGAQHA